MGWNSVTVPGAVSAWVALHAKFGRLPFPRLFEPAITYGRRGFLVSPTVATQWARQVPMFASQPGFAQAFLRDGRAPRPGELFTFPEHAATLENLASRGDRMVGVITHVPGLAERVPVRFAVRRDQRSARIEREGA